MSTKRTLFLTVVCAGLAGRLWLQAGAQSANPTPSPTTSPVPAEPVPEPSPTEAGVSPDKRFTAVGTARAHPSPAGEAGEGPRQAARLSAMRQLMQTGAELVGLLPDEKSGRSGYQFLQVNADHPHDALLSWVMRAEENPEVAGKEIRVSLTSPPLSDLNNDFPQFVRSVKVDTDGDGQPDLVGAGYDGRIHVLRKSPRGFDRLATSPCLTSYTHVTYTTPGARQPIWEQVRLTRLTSVHSVEVVSPGKVRVVAELQSSEEVAGEFLGRATEEREVLVRIQQPGLEPTLELEQPRDFTHTSESSVSLKGLFRAPEGIASARLRYNGRPFWQTPENLNSRKLRMDVIVPLLPGWNSAQTELIDSAHRVLSREVLLRRDAPPPPIQPGRRRALLVGIGAYQSPNFESISSAEADVESLKRFIMGPQNGAGFALQNVVALKGEQATRSAIIKALTQLRVEQSSPTNQDRIFTLIYFAGLTAKSAGMGKGLLPWDARGVDEGALRAQDLIEALGPLGNQDVLLILDTAQCQLTGPRASSWLDTQDFCQRLERNGWAVIASGDLTPSERGSGEGGRFTGLLLRSLAGSGDADNDGLVEFDELYRDLFDLWMAQGKASQAPLRRGTLLGRTPVVTVRR